MTEIDQPALPTFARGLPLTRQAIEYARERHSGQTRESDEAPFILHPLEVASLLHNTGSPDHVVAAGVLHEILEDTDAALPEFEARFGSEVARLVAAVTEDSEVEPYEERKGRLRRQIAHSDPSAAAIYAADKLAKVREHRAKAREGDAATRAGVSDLKLDHYVASLATLEDVIPDHPLVRQLRFELEALRDLPPRRRGGGAAS